MTHQLSTSPFWSSGSRSSTSRSDDDALGDLEDLRRGLGQILRLEVALEVGPVLLGDAVVERLVRLLVERVEEAGVVLLLSMIGSHFDARLTAL